MSDTGVGAQHVQRLQVAESLQRDATIVLVRDQPHVQERMLARLQLPCTAHCPHLAVFSHRVDPLQRLRVCAAPDGACDALQATYGICPARSQPVLL